MRPIRISVSQPESTPPFLLELTQPRAYPHPCTTIELIQTHISWVLLTGEFAYKLKKPVDFGFLDFSTLALRRHYCAEEVRLNRRFAQALYLDVVAITRSAGRVRVGGDGEVIEYAVRMRQFDGALQLDRRLADGRLEANDLVAFAASLAAVHAVLPRCDDERPFGTPTAVLGPVRENFAQIAGSPFADVHADRIAEIARWSETQHVALSALIAQRRADGFVRECHGDLHLSNLVALDDGIHAFDCIEFSEGLRWIDVISDAAFLVMDCAVRGRNDLAYSFLNAYLEATGDYAGGALLGFYLVYRSMVRAKVAALQAQSADDAALLRFEAHVRFAAERASNTRGALILMCGLSGSGKSWLAERLVPALPALRVRSDVERKRLAGLAADARSGSAVDAGLYAREQSDAVYAWLASAAAALVTGGESAIIDATFLTTARRRTFRDEATRLGRPFVIVHCTASPDVLAARIERREREAKDASEATLEVLEAQRRNHEPPTAAEGTVIAVDTGAAFDIETIAQRIRRVIARV
jgi:hypothetical protein